MTREKGRPPYFLADPTAWNGSSALRGMKAHQVGWYIQLLMDAWLSTPQATLPNNPSKLEIQSRYSQSLKDLQHLFDDVEQAFRMCVSIAFKDFPPEQLEQILRSVIGPLRYRYVERLNGEWKNVLHQFQTMDNPKAEGEELLFNPRQIAELQRWIESYQQKQDGGRKGAEKRWGPLENNDTTGVNLTKAFGVDDSRVITPQKSAALAAQKIADEQRASLETVVDSDVLPLDVDMSQNSSPIANPFLKMGDPMRNVKNSNVSELKDNSSTTDVSTESTNVLVLTPPVVTGKTLLKKKPETIFDENRFVITEGMLAHLTQKYPEFVVGDWEYLVEKFKNVNYGKKYISWKRTFYNFVGNQVTLYGYTPGAFNWRRSQDQQNSQRPPSQAQQNLRDADELAKRYLQESSAGDNQVDPEVLPLT